MRVPIDSCGFCSFCLTQSSCCYFDLEAEKHWCNNTDNLSDRERGKGEIVNARFFLVS